MKADKKLAIEVKSRSSQAEPHIQELQELFSSHPEWELRIIYAPTQNAERTIAVPPRKLVLENLDRLLEIFDEAGPVSCSIDWLVGVRSRGARVDTRNSRTTADPRTMFWRNLRQKATSRLGKPTRFLTSWTVAK